MNKKLNFILEVERSKQFTGVPSPRNIVNSFDHLGLTVGVKRISEESNSSYRERIWDASVNPAGSVYREMLNGIARDFGFLKQEVFKIDLKRSSDGEALASSPQVEVYANRIVLYHNYRMPTKEIDKEVYFYKPDSSGYYIGDLMRELQSSEYFTIEVASGIRENLLSKFIMKDTTKGFAQEGSRATKTIILSEKNVVPESFYCSDVSAFLTEVYEEPNRDGEYLINYKEGIVYTYSIPKIGHTINYSYNYFPISIKYMPVQVNSLSDEDYVDELYIYEENEHGQLERTFLNKEGTEVYHELYLKNRMFWGV
jgi:hypothetical protein